ncbi:hypothetical protein AB1J99_30355 [Bacillus bombysepticus]|uniref:Uncharacterized protein n=1 Tax=Bacillus cereus (strain G9842) TaxID=405531 RepID=B7IZD8_BACC2|nr:MULTISPECIES: hypothetical protein [Bacillus cereus group]ACK98583.1 hypothetical protein BCG9842_0115 [Bacillus cereus G9842]
MKDIYSFLDSPFADWTGREIATVILFLGALFFVGVIGCMFKK